MENVFLVRRLLNIVGGGCTLLSLNLPWSVYGPVFFSVWNAYNGNWPNWFAPWLILFGGLVSLLSRYGAIATFSGTLAYLMGGSLMSVPPGATYEFSWMAGFWLAWSGILISLAGHSWNLPFLSLKKWLGAGPKGWTVRPKDASQQLRCQFFGFADQDTFGALIEVHHDRERRFSAMSAPSLTVI